MEARPGFGWADMVALRDAVLEENFVTSMIKSGGNLMMFFSRPIAGGLAAATIIILLWPVVAWLFRRPRVAAA